MSTAATQSGASLAPEVPDPLHRDEYDYVVVGGGPVGAVMALGLASQQHSVALIERNSPADDPLTIANDLGVDPRTVALSQASQELLLGYGAWPTQAIGAFQRMEVWEDRGTSVLRFGAAEVAAEYHSGALGYIAEVGPWRAQLWQQLAESEVVCLTGLPVVAVDQDPAGYALELAAAERSRRVIARTLIAADGANSVVRAALDVPMTLTDTGQSALAFAAQMSAPHEFTAFQRFLADGPLALLPMANEHLVSVVWSARNSRADELAELETEALAAALTRASEERLGQVVRCLPAARFPLRQGVIQNFCPCPNVVFIGDAARVVHPLAGQGVNLGFEDVRALLKCTGAASSSRPATASLQRFARVRRARSRLAVAAMSALSAGYAGQSPAMLLARNFTTRTLAGSPLLRRQLVLEAMGLGPLARAS